MGFHVVCLVTVALLIATASVQALNHRSILQSNCGIACSATRSPANPEALRPIANSGICSCFCTRGRWSPLHLAASSGCGLCINLLTSNPGSCSCDQLAFNNATPLHVAASRCSGPLTSDLLTAGCNPNARNSQGNTPLCLASTVRNDECGQVVRTLLSKGAQPCLRCQGGQTAFERCTYTNTCNVLRQDGAANCL